jgi:predicted metal-dependent hydrolase
MYDAWFPESRTIVFYEDFIVQSDEILVKLLDFMEEEAVYLDDFVMNKEEYLSRLLQSYSEQHKNNRGGSSIQGSPKPIHYTRNADFETLKYIDEYIQRMAPELWEKYLKRYQSLEGM